MRILTRRDVGLINQWTFGRQVISFIGFDPDASAFILATGITDSMIINAINSLVVDLKNFGIWTKCNAIYPFVGGTATTHKFNLKDPRDLDIAFRLNFVGGWTHSANGAVGNTINTFANTFLNPLSVFTTKTSIHLLVYIRNNSIAGSFPYDISASFNTFGDNGTYLITRRSSNIFYGGIADSSFTLNASSIDSRGFSGVATNGNLTGVLYKNGIQVATNATGGANLANFNLYLGANNAGGTLFGSSDRQIAFNSIGTGLSATDMTNYYTAVQAFQTTLSRQV